VLTCVDNIHGKLQHVVSDFFAIRLLHQFLAFVHHKVSLFPFVFNFSNFKTLLLCCYSPCAEVTWFFLESKNYKLERDHVQTHNQVYNNEKQKKKRTSNLEPN